MGPEPSLAITAVLLVGLVGFGFGWGWWQERKAKREHAKFIESVREGQREMRVQIREDLAQHIKRRRGA